MITLCEPVKMEMPSLSLSLSSFLSFFFLTRTECYYEHYIMLEHFILGENQQQKSVLVVSPDYKDQHVI